MSRHTILGNYFGSVVLAGISILVGCASDAGVGGTQEEESSTTQSVVRHAAARSRGRAQAAHLPRRGHHRHGHGCGHGNGSGDPTGNMGTGGASLPGTGGASSTSEDPGAGNAPNWSTGGVVGTGGGQGSDPSVCGDAAVQWWAEGCDDGNVNAGDGCDSSCALEPGFVCESAGEPCRPVVCGDGRQDWYMIDASEVEEPGNGAGGSDYSGTGGVAGYVGHNEQCDDGNAESGDGCDASCHIEDWYVCEEAGLACRAVVCGDGLLDYYFLDGQVLWESCDDNNTASGDGCSSDCTQEAGWVCDAAGVPCRQPTCGDGHQDWYPDPNSGTGGASSGATTPPTGGGGGTTATGTSEGCDDGNQVSGDGCSASCQVEEGWSCYPSSDSCHLIVCGDEYVDWPAEECDDGNDVAGDGCDDCVEEYVDATGGAGGGFSTGGTVSGTGGVAVILMGGALGLPD